MEKSIVLNCWPEFLHFFSFQYPDASMDSDKLKMLENNVNMMTAELNKICRLFKIKELNRDDLSQYPEGKKPQYCRKKMEKK